MFRLMNLNCLPDLEITRKLLRKPTKQTDFLYILFHMMDLKNEVSYPRLRGFEGLSG